MLCPYLGFAVLTLKVGSSRLQNVIVRYRYLNKSKVQVQQQIVVLLVLIKRFWCPLFIRKPRKKLIIIILMPRNSKKQASNEPQCTICMERHANCSLDGCSHQFCLRCIRKWATTKNSCPLCRERIRVLTCKNNVYEVRPIPERIRVVRPATSSQQTQQRRIVILPLVVYPQAGCFFYPQATNLFYGSSIGSFPGMNYPLGAPTFFFPSSQ